MRKVLYGVILLFLFTGCYDEPDEHLQAGLLTSVKWRRASWTSSPAYTYTFSDGSRGTYTDLFKLYLPCAHDNEYLFEMDSEANSGGFGSYTYQEGVVTCGSNKILETGKWFTVESASAIHIYFEYPDSDYFNRKVRRIYKVEEITQSRLVFTYELTSGYTWREEYVRQ